MKNSSDLRTLGLILIIFGLLSMISTALLGEFIIALGIEETLSFYIGVNMWYDLVMTSAGLALFFVKRKH